MTDIKLNHAGMAKMLKSREVLDAVGNIALEVGSKVQDPGHRSGPVNVYVHEKVGRTRGLAWVSVTHPLMGLLERRYAVLRNALWRR